MDAYLDAEFSYRRFISVLGVYREDTGFHQLVGRKINPPNIAELFRGCHRVVTFNGTCCEIPMIRKWYGVDLKIAFESLDLFHFCRRRRIFGKMKEIEKLFGIERKVRLSGQGAMNLWYWYKRESDWFALQKLLDYNREDVMNLKLLHERLCCV